jgi:quinoprotein glucose dehydrogenase
VNILSSAKSVAPSFKGRRTKWLVAAMAGLALASHAQAQDASASPGASFDHVEWEGYLGGGDSSQYSSLEQITKDNVDQLEPVWTYEAGGGPFGNTFGPTVANGVMYVAAHGNALVALDAATGEELWRHEFEGGIGSRGVNYWESEDGSEARLLVLNGGMLRAIDAKTGEMFTDFGSDGGVDLRDALESGEPPARPLQTNNPGRIFEDLIIMSLPAGAYDYASSPADIQAYNVRTGEHVWTFHTVPREGEFGYDTWPEEGHDRFGGVHNWSESTVDEELGIVFIPTGTARFDFYGGNRVGDNLFANSLIALDARTGERIWHFQTVHHDLWDFDLPTAPKLMTIERNGEDVPIVIQTSKQGLIFTFDRRTGEPIWPIEERPVPASDVPGEVASPTQPFPTWPEPYTRDRFTEADINPYLSDEDKEKVREILRTSRNEGRYTPPSLEGSISLPGHNGGSNWGNVAVDPERKRMYVVARHIPTMDKLNPDRRENSWELQPNGTEGIPAYRSPVDFMYMSDGMSALGPPWSTIIAYDMQTGNKLWTTPNGEIMTLAEKGITGTGSQAPRGGPVTTASGIVFVGTATDRKLRARDGDTGQILWEYDLDAATEGVPAIYEVDGRQYVAIPVGGVGHFAGALGLPEPGSSKFVAFALPEGE